MNLWKIAWRSIQQRGLSSSLTAISMALGVALVVAVLVIHHVVETSFQRAAEGFDIIVGAKGGKLQLVLNTIYHLSTPIENIPWNYYQEFKTGKYSGQVSAAIPYCLGDNYQGYRVVGTIAELFNGFEYREGEPYRFAAGNNFAPDHYFEAVVGALVARRTGLKVGDHFRPTHGVIGDEGAKHDEFEVVGVLEPTGTPSDRAVFVNIEGFFLLEGHAKPKPKSKAAPDAASEPAANDEPPAPAGAEHNRGLLPLPDDQREVTAILVRTASPIAGVSLPKMINKEPYAQAVMPIREIANLFEGIVGNVQFLLMVLTALVVIVSGVSIMVGIYNSMNDRRREIAIMRALGARRETVMSVVLCESILLGVGGGLIGMLVGHGAIGVLSPLVAAETGVSIGFFHLSQWELILIPLLVVLAVVVGFLPALVAYRTDVARTLTSAP